jgi:hypothetical protein
MDTGWKTTEFWLTIVSGLLMSLKGILPEFPAEGIYAIITYIISRTIVKAVTTATASRMK